MLVPVLIVIFIVLVALGSYFGAAETAFTAMNKIRIKALADEGNKKARRAMYIANNFERALTTLLIGNNITHIGAGAVATSIVIELWENKLFGNISKETASFLYGTVIATLLVFMFAEMIPKSHANDRSETLALRYSTSLCVLMKVLYPLVVFFSWIANLVSKLFTGPDSPSITEDELYDIIDTAEEEGVMDEKQSNMMKSALDFSDTKVSDVMTMRDDIVGIDVNLSTAAIVRRIQDANHSRFPVYDGNIDNIVGTVLIRSFLKEYMKNPNVSIKSVMSKPYYVKPDDNINDRLNYMSQEKKYIAVVGEPGKTLGVVTVEDFLEEIVGEIWDEDDIIDENFIKLGGNRFLVSTHMTVGEVFRRMGVRCPEKRLIQRSVLSWILENFGHFPDEDESLTKYNVEVSVEDIEDNVVDPENGRIDKVVFHPLPKTSPDTGKEVDGK